MAEMRDPAKVVADWLRSVQPEWLNLQDDELGVVLYASWAAAKLKAKDRRVGAE
jgi:hypothetical protein